MTEEAMIPNMRRRGEQKKKSGLSVVKLLLLLFCLLILIGSNFLNINIKHFIIPSDLFTNKNLTFDSFVYSLYFIPQIPVLLFTVSILGKRLAVTCAMLYILTGLFLFPIFALGGGLTYIAQYGFGYIIGFVPAVKYAGDYLDKKTNILSALKAVLAGVLIIHILGVLYMVLIALIRHSGWGFITNWIAAQSGLKILYDIVFGLAFVLAGNIIREGLKFITE